MACVAVVQLDPDRNSVRRTGSLWWAVGAHTAWNWAQEFLFGFPNSGSASTHRLLASHPQGFTWLSGGPAGAEGSVLRVPVLLAMALAIHRTLRAERAR